MALKWKKGAPKTAIVTGAASGLGQRVAQILLDAGCRVAAMDVAFDAPARDALTDHAQSANQVTFHDMDVAVFDSVGQAVDAAIAAHGAPDLVLNSAGINIPLPLAEMPPDIFSRVIDVNLKGSWHLAKAAAPHLNAGAHIVLIASLAGRVPNYGYSAYSPSKFGVVGLAGVLELELNARGIDITTVCPGAFRTPLADYETTHGSRIGVKLRDVGGFQELEPTVQAIMRGVARRQRTVIPSLRARLLEFSARLAPGIGFATTHRMLRKEMRLTAND